MFRIKPLVPRRGTDPLRTRRSAYEWFRGLPALDVIARQERVIHAFAQLRHARAAFDIDRIAAILYLDSATAVDHRRVLRWYLDDRSALGELADHFWQVARDVTSGFVYAYDAAHRQALAQLTDRHWRGAFPCVLARLIHHHGVDVKLRLFVGERPIPAKWSELNTLFLRAREHRCDRDTAPLLGEDPLETHSSVEQEYLHVLLIDQLHTGNLTPAELDWAGTKLRTWGRQLRLAAVPPAAGGFYVDMAGSAGLVRRNGRVHGDKLGYLDTTPLVAEIENARARLREPGPDGKPARDWRTQWKIAILDKVQPAISPCRDADLRRHPRVAANVVAEVRIGLARITRALMRTEQAENPVAPTHGSDEGFARADASPRRQSPDIRIVTTPAAAASRNAAQPSRPGARAAAAPTPRPIPPVRPRELPAWAHAEAEEIEINDVAEDTTIQPLARTAEGAPPPARPSEWRIQDHSTSGWKLSAPDELAGKLTLGALVAVRAADAAEWMLGVVSRLSRRRNRETEAGMSMLGGRIVPVTLHGRRLSQADMGFEVDGVDASMLGARFDGLYVVPPPRNAEPPQRTLVIPRSEHFEGRRVIIATARAHYTVTLGPVIDQRADWSWVSIRIDTKAARAA